MSVHNFSYTLPDRKTPETNSAANDEACTFVSFIDDCTKYTGRS